MTDTPNDSANTPEPVKAQPEVDQTESIVDAAAQSTPETPAVDAAAPVTPASETAVAPTVEVPAATAADVQPTVPQVPVAPSAAETQPTVPQVPVAPSTGAQPQVAAQPVSPQPAAAQPDYGNGAFGQPAPTPTYAPYGAQPAYATYPAQPGAPVAPGAAKPARKRGTGVLIATLAIGALIGGVAGGGVVGIYAATQSNTVKASSAAGAANITVNNPNDATTVTAVAAKASPSVVTISVTGGSSGGTGSGIILTSDGYVLTNTHVVTLDGQASDVTVQVQDNDGKLYSAKVIGTDPTTDLAVIKLNNASGLTPATFADSSKLNVGDLAVAIGAPLGLSGTVTNGIISALNRSISIASSAAPTSGDGSQDGDGSGSGGDSGSPFNLWNFDFPGQGGNGGGNGGGESQSQPQSTPSISLPVIQTDAAINPGNSGGALLNDNGEVIGVNVAIASAGDSSASSGQSGSIGVGFAIPANLAQRIAQDLIKNGKASHGLLGASVADATSDAKSTTVGAEIKEITSGGAADKGGLKAGDIITNFNGLPITSATDLTAQVRAVAGGSTADVTYVRGGQTATTTVTLGTLSTN